MGDMQVGNSWCCPLQSSLQPHGVCTWVLQQRTGGSSHHCSLGTWPPIQASGHASGWWDLCCKTASSYLLWISVSSTASAISQATHMLTSFAPDGMYLSKRVLLRAGKRMEAGTYMRSLCTRLPQMGQLACEKPVGCSKDWSWQHRHSLSLARCFFEFGFKELAQARQKEEIWGNLKWLGICYCNQF